MENPCLIGTKVYLRALEREDADMVKVWINDPEVSRFMLNRAPLNRRAEEMFIERATQLETAVIFVIVRIDVDQPIGVTGLHEINFRNRHAQFGITIGDKSTWGHGFGTEATILVLKYAFESINLHRVMLQVYEYNERAVRLYEKIGFKHEGVLRQENYREGRYWDTMIMSMLRPEWDELWFVGEGEGRLKSTRREQPVRKLST